MQPTATAKAKERVQEIPRAQDLNILRVSLRDLLQVLFKRKWSFLFVAMATFLAGALWIFFIRDDAYQVSAKVMVRIGHEQANTAAVAGPPIMITGERMQDVNTEADILGSTDLIAKVVDHFKMYQPEQPDPVPERLLPRIKYHIRERVKRLRDWRDEQLIRAGLKERVDRRDAIINFFREALSVKAEKNSNVITATLLVPARKDSGRLLNTLLDFYQSFRLQMYRDGGTRDFFRAETGGADAQLRQIEDELRTFEETANISAIDKQKELLLSEITDLERSAAQAALETQEVLGKLARVEAEMKADDPNFATIGAFPANSFPDQLLQQLATLQKEREVLRMTDKDASTRIRNNRNQFRVLLNLIATHLRSVAAERQGVSDARQQELAARRAELRGLMEKQTTWHALKRKAKVLEENYLVNRKRLDETTASVAMEKKNLGNVVVIEHAVDAVEPLGMSKVKLLGLALLLAIIAALGWLAIAEFFDHGVYTADALERRFGLRVLGVVPVGKAPRMVHASQYARGD